MSSISGRFLYQFGITAAVAILVSLLVSFTLTPMMSARLLRAEDAGGGHDSGDEEVSRFRDASVNEDYDVQLRLTDRDRKDAATISRLYVPSSRGGLVRLDNFITLTEERSPSRIDRLDRQRQVSLRALRPASRWLIDWKRFAAR